MPRRILFVCTGNTCRSPMAEALANHAGHGEVEAWSERASGGSSGRVSAEAEATLRAAGLPAAAVRRNPRPHPLAFDEVVAIDAPGSDANAAAARARGLEVARVLRVPDPVGGGAAAYAAAYGLLREALWREWRLPVPALPRDARLAPPDGSATRRGSRRGR